MPLACLSVLNASHMNLHGLSLRMCDLEPQQPNESCSILAYLHPFVNSQK
jgi:hypothetical protein